MVAKCANPACNREFRELSKGRLFLLPPTRGANSGPAGSVERLSDYCYWLCPDCDATHVIVRRDSDVLVSVRGPGTPYPVAARSPGSEGPGQSRLRSYTEAG